MSKHTEGPWHVGGRHKCTVYDKFGQRVADAFEGVMATQRTDEGCRANARLIAAAPELLEALDGLLARAKKELADPEDVHEVYKAEIAIAKAKGESA